MSDEKDDVAARRKALAEALRNGQDVVVAPSGEVEFKSEAQEDGQTASCMQDSTESSPTCR